jgi:hypothetical protein
MAFLLLEVGELLPLVAVQVRALLAATAETA